jgi:hypothetical protein
MAVGDPILLGSLATDGVFLMTPQTGIIVNSFKRKVSGDKIEFYDASVGQTTGKVLFDFKAEITIKGAVNGTDGVMAAVVGSTLSFNDEDSSGFGVSQGGAYIDSVETDHQPKQLREVTVTMTQLNQIA